MKKILTILTGILACVTNFAQITTMTVASKTEQITKIPYDSTVNFLGTNVFGYIGQELYLIGAEKEVNYKYFLKNLKFDSDGKGNTYKPTYGGSSESKYKDLAEKYYIVLEVLKYPKPDKLNENIYFLKLQEKESKDILYFQYNSEYDFEFPFVTVGYFLKQKKTAIGKQYVIRGKNWNDWHNPDSKITDIRTGLPVSNFQIGGVWTVVDINILKAKWDISQPDFSRSIVLTIENSGKERGILPILCLDYQWALFKKDEADKYQQKFGQAIWNNILKGSVQIGMTEEMCLLSWGNPKKINKTITEGKQSEQWVYPSDKYLYLENGLLTAMQ